MSSLRADMVEGIRMYPVQTNAHRRSSQRTTGVAVTGDLSPATTARSDARRDAISAVR
jgi:hypothetical protein